VSLLARQELEVVLQGSHARHGTGDRFRGISRVLGIDVSRQDDVAIRGSDADPPRLDALVGVKRGRDPNRQQLIAALDVQGVCRHTLTLVSDQLRHAVDARLCGSRHGHSHHGDQREQYALHGGCDAHAPHASSTGIRSFDRCDAAAQSNSTFLHPGEASPVR
jgi:hypothetical protein